MARTVVGARFLDLKGGRSRPEAQSHCRDQAERGRVQASVVASRNPRFREKVLAWFDFSYENGVGVVFSTLRLMIKCCHQKRLSFPFLNTAAYKSAGGAHARLREKVLAWLDVS